MTTPPFVLAMRELSAQLAEAGVRAVEVDPDGRVVFEGAEFALVLPAPRLAEAAAPLLIEDAVSDVDRAVELPVAGDGAALAEPESPPAAIPQYAPHAGRHRFRDGVCTRCGAPEVATAVPKTKVAVTATSPDGGGPSPFRPTPPPPRRQGPDVCPRCGGRVDLKAIDEFREPDPHCMACGWRRTRAALPGEDPDVLPDGVQRRREPSHGGARL